MPQNHNKNGSNIFLPFRGIGIICDSTPVSIYSLGTEHFATVSVGNAWQTIDLKHMRLVMVSPQRANQIQNIATIVDPNGALTFTSSGSNITAWRRNHVVGQLKGHMGDISLLEPLGRLLISYGSDQKIYFWDTSDLPKSFSSSMKILELNPSSFIEVKEDDVVTSISHPPTYVNKILLGFASGNAQLWNIRSLKLLYEFNFEKEESFENVGSITCIANSPALDIVAIGFSSGMIQLHHLKLDKKIMSFYMDGGHSITSLSFRTDGVPILASGASSGQIAFWDLDQKRLLDLLIEAHSEAVSTLRYLDEEPLLISSSGDNSMKMWIFDSPESTARLLKFRQGHSGNPTRLRFDEEGKFILSASKDRTLRLFSIFRDQQSVELSQGNLSHRAKKSKESIQNLRLPTVTDFDWSFIKSRYWDCIVTSHEGSNVMHTWSLEKKSIGAHKIALKNANEVITSVKVSVCGNFAFVGTSKGRLLKYNLQSGSFRGEYLSESNHSDDFVVGIATDAFNKIIVAVLSKGRILCWDLNTLKFKEETSIGTRISQVEVHRDSGLFAIVCEDFSVRVFDISNLRCIRTLRGNKFRITDISFSSDAHWIASAAVDGSVRVYDLASSTLIDCFRFSSPVTTLALSPSGEFLATAHADNVGIFLWVNKSYFSNLYLRSVDNFPKYMDFPEEEIKLDADFLERLQNDNSADEEMADDIKATSEKFGRVGFVPIESNMIIRSGLPNSKWETLDKLELIKERNKPKLPIKKNTEVPFFLEQAFEAVDEKESEEKEVSEISHAESDSVLSLLLSKCSRDGSYSDITAYLMSLMPAALETEFRVLSFDVDEMEQDEKAIIEERLEQMLQYFKHELISRKNYELIQAYLNLFLQIHREELVSSKSLLDQLSEISALQSDEWQRLESLFHSNSCLLNFCSNIQF